MRVGDYMTRDPITIEEDASMKEAMLLLRSHHIRHLPVATGRLLVGLVSDRDIKRASPSILQGIDKTEFEQLMEDTPVSRIMTREPFTVKETTPLVEAVTILVEKKFGSLPVVDGKELIGIFTEIDALKILLDELNKK
ncbi:MAG TPA: CBS domain-containing protein [Vicinamibacteria bacterium]